MATLLISRIRFPVPNVKVENFDLEVGNSELLIQPERFFSRSRSGLKFYFESLPPGSFALLPALIDVPLSLMAAGLAEGRTEEAGDRSDGRAPTARSEGR